MRAGLVWVWFASFLLLMTAVPAAAAPPEIAVSAGQHNILDGGDGGELGVELRGAPYRLTFLPPFVPGLIPVAGVMMTSKSLAYGYAGLRADLLLGGRWVLTPGFAAGLYRQGDGADLGGPVEFRSSIELAYRLGAASCLGLGFYHLSNAGLYSLNPGSESLILSWTVGLGR
jgi:hypothetical protein